MADLSGYLGWESRQGTLNLKLRDVDPAGFVLDSALLTCTCPTLAVPHRHHLVVRRSERAMVKTVGRVLLARRPGCAD
jgi:hypothetical protein